MCIANERASISRARVLTEPWSNQCVSAARAFAWSRNVNQRSCATFPLKRARVSDTCVATCLTGTSEQLVAAAPLRHGMHCARPHPPSTPTAPTPWMRVCIVWSRPCKLRFAAARQDSAVPITVNLNCSTQPCTPWVDMCLCNLK